MVLPTGTAVLASIAGLIAVMTWRVREARGAVSLKKIVMPPLGMATGFCMFIAPPFRVPLLWALIAFAIGAVLLAWPLLATSRLVRDGDAIMMKRNGAFFAVVVFLAAIRYFARGYFDSIMTLEQTAGLFFVLAFGMIQRQDLPRQCMIKLIETASANVRAVLEATNPEAVAAVREAVDEVATAIRREALAPARGEEFQKTVDALTKLGPFPAEQVERALLDQGADMILIFAKAARWWPGWPPSFLFGNSNRSRTRWIAHWQRLNIPTRCPARIPMSRSSIRNRECGSSWPAAMAPPSA